MQPLIRFCIFGWMILLGGQQVGRYTAAETPPASPNLPKLLILVRKDPKTPNSDLPQRLAGLLKQSLNSSSLYTPLLYSPYDPTVKNALLNHLLTPKDLSTLDSPASQQRLAEAYDARYLLSIQPHILSMAVEVDVSLFYRAPAESWTMPYSNRLRVDMPPTRRGVTEELRYKALLYGLVDSISAAIGSPTHLLASLPITLPQTVALNDAHSASGQKAIDLASTPSSSPPIQPTPPNYVAQAQDALRDGNVADAIMLLRQAIDANPFDPKPRALLIQTYLQRHLVALADTEAQDSLLLCPNSVELTQLEAQVLQAKGDTKGALQLFTQLVAHNPQDVAARIALGDALLANGQYADAQNAYEMAASINAKSVLPALRLAALFVKEANSDPSFYAKGLSELETARQLLPSTDTTSYLNCYATLMPVLSERIHDDADALQQIYESCVQGGLSVTEALRNLADLQNRLVALSDFLTKLPPAVGAEKAQAAYGQSAALLLQGIGYFHDVLSDPARTPREAADTLALARANTLHALQEADTLLKNLLNPPPAKPPQNTDDAASSE
ncbi:tetratricopeptide repeat protein [Chthonomonas calidirosea]|uniref:tetratricopeptide repeat protein n=1 Tax=Chthonomonas calidirosea TaxID=454171 RepID=UPI0006ECA9A4|nr:tetratricopeptide repeat protein [Chthonomonas calidirosea]CEK18059.1 Tetratricopeptide repeat [Chthonomonas calidirosea]